MSVLFLVSSRYPMDLDLQSLTDLHLAVYPDTATYLGFRLSFAWYYWDCRIRQYGSNHVERRVSTILRHICRTIM